MICEYHPTGGGEQRRGRHAFVVDGSGVFIA
jgi:hypothetical protein